MAPNTPYSRELLFQTIMSQKVVDYITTEHWQKVIYGESKCVITFHPKGPWMSNSSKEWKVFQCLQWRYLLLLSSSMLRSMDLLFSITLLTCTCIWTFCNVNFHSIYPCMTPVLLIIGQNEMKCTQILNTKWQGKSLHRLFSNAKGR